MKRIALVACLSSLAALAAWVRFGPIDERLLSHGSSIAVYDRNGEILYEPVTAHGTRRSALEADELPPQVVEATLAAEDRRFFAHPGIDPVAVARAFVHNVRARRIVEGGSTITQQVAKLMLRTRETRLGRKVREAILAQRLEHRFTKREILAMYLNLAPYGNRIDGIARASRMYFGCAPAQLTVAQAAYLASLPQRPSAFNPLRDPNRARERQLRVLAAMNLTPENRAIAERERLQFRKETQTLIAQHYVERVLGSWKNAEDSWRTGEARTGETPVLHTSLDAGLQREVTGIIAAHRAKLLRHGARAVAVAVLDNRTGEWLAWEGSGDYFGEDFGGAIDGVVTPRQPGSTLKPFTYALAFERGQTPASVVLDEPQHFATAQEGVVYTPRNYDGKYRGKMLIRSALAGSQNVPAVATLADLGPSSLLRFLREAGITSLTHHSDYYGLGLTLGDAEMPLEELVRAYAILARGGVSIEGKRLLSQRTAFWISDILSDDDARAYAFGEGGSLDFPFRVAVKTGTSQAYRDNWTIGYTRDVTVGVWVGNFDRTELRNSSGVTGAAPIFNGVMLAAVKRARGQLPVGDERPIVEPDGVERLPICTASGKRPSTRCERTAAEWMPAGVPAEFCALSHESAPVHTAKQIQNPKPKIQNLKVLAPADGATFLIDPTLRSEFQQVRFRASAAAKWYVNDQPAKSEWTLRRGQHTITAVDAKGRRDSVKIFVK